MGNCKSTDHGAEPGAPASGRKRQVSTAEKIARAATPVVPCPGPPPKNGRMSITLKSGGALAVNLRDEPDTQPDAMIDAGAAGVGAEPGGDPAARNPLRPAGLAIAFLGRAGKAAAGGRAAQATSSNVASPTVASGAATPTAAATGGASQQHSPGARPAGHRQPDPHCQPDPHRQPDPHHQNPHAGLAPREVSRFEDSRASSFASTGSAGWARPGGQFPSGAYEELITPAASVAHPGAHPAVLRSRPCASANGRASGQAAAAAVAEEEPGEDGDAGCVVSYASPHASFTSVEGEAGSGRAERTPLVQVASAGDELAEAGAVAGAGSGGKRLGQAPDVWRLGDAAARLEARRGAAGADAGVDLGVGTGAAAGTGGVAYRGSDDGRAGGGRPPPQPLQQQHQRSSSTPRAGAHAGATCDLLRRAAANRQRAAALGIAGGAASPGALSSGSGSGPGSAEVSPTAAAAAAVATGAGGIAGHDTGSDDDHLHHGHAHQGEGDAGEGEVEPSGKSLWGKARAATALVRLRQEAAARAAATAAATGAARNKLEYVPQPPARRPRGVAIGSPPVLATDASAASVGLSGPMSADRALAPHGTPVAAAAAAAAAAQMAAAAGLQGAGSYQRPLGVESSEPLLHRAEAVAFPPGHGPPHGTQPHPHHQQPHLHSPQATAAQRAEAFLRARAQSERFRSPGAARWDLSPPPAPVAPLPLAFMGAAPYQSPHAKASLGSEYSGLSGVSGGRTPAPVPEHVIRPQHLHHRPPAHAATSSGMLQASRVEQLLPYHQQPQQQPQPRKSLQPRGPAKDTPTKTVSMGRSAREYWALKAQLQELDAQRTPSQRFAEEEAVRRRDRRREMGYTSSSSSSSDGEDGQPRLTQLQKLIARRRNTADNGTMPDAAATLAAIQAIAALGGGGGDGAAAGEAAAAVAGADAGVEGARGTLWSLYPKAAKAASLKAGPSRGSLMGGTTAPPERITPSRRQTTTADGAAAAAAAAAAAGYYTSNSNSGAQERIGPGSAPPVLTPLAASILAAAGVPSSSAAVAATAAQHSHHPHPYQYQQYPPPHHHGSYLQPPYYAGGGGVPMAAAAPPPGSVAAPSSMEVWAALQALAGPPPAPESSTASYPDPRPAVPVMPGPLFAPPGQPYPGLVVRGAELPTGGGGVPGVGYCHPGTGPGSAPATRQRNSLSVPDAGVYGGSGGGSPRAAAAAVAAAAAAAGGGGHLTWQQQLLEQQGEVEVAEAAQRQHQQHQQQQHYMQAAAFAGADGDGGGNGGGGWGAARFAPGAVAGYHDGDVEGGRSSAPTSSATARVQLWRAGGLGGSGHYGKYLGPSMAAEALAAAGAGGGGGGAAGGGSNSFRGGRSPLHSPRVHPLPPAPGGAAGGGGGGGGGGAAAAGSRHVSDTGCTSGNTSVYDNALYDDDRRPVDPAAHEQQRRQQQRQQQDAAWCAAAAVAAAESHDVFGSSGGGAGGHGGRGPAPQGFVPYDAQGLAEDGQPSPALAAAAAAALAEDEGRMSSASSPQRQWAPLQHAPQSAQGSSVTVSGGRGVAPGVAPGAGAGTAAGEDAGGAGPGAAPQPQPWEARRRLGPAPPSGGGALPESESAEFLAVLEKAALVSTKVAAAVAAGELG